jgi:predicted O-methyltransferase YrrM
VSHPHGIDARAARVLDALERRSSEERALLDELRAQGGSAVRQVASRLMLDVGPDTGLFLNQLVRATRAEHVLEVGGSVGYSTVWFAEAARAVGGRVTSLEVDDGKHHEQRRNLDAAGLADVVDLVLGDLEHWLARRVAPPTLVLLDHWKEMYEPDLARLWPVLAPGALVLADNILVPVKNAPVIEAYLRYVRGLPDARSQTIPIGCGVEQTVKLAEAA